MGFSLESVVPWGRSLDEYVQMFGMTTSDLAKKIIGCGDGPASFNAEMTNLGASVVSVDPIYRFSKEEIQNRIDQTCLAVSEQLQKNKHDYVWHKIASVEQLVEVRLEAMNKFLIDFSSGKDSRRYLDFELPKLPFKDSSFDLALCSHLLFLYSDQLDFEFHLDSISEMLRVAEEVRVYPLLKLDGRPSPFVDRICENMKAIGVQADRIKVDYEFQKGANYMLSLRKA